jgi:hypothetical protein
MATQIGNPGLGALTRGGAILGVAVLATSISASIVAGALAYASRISPLSLVGVLSAIPVTAFLFRKSWAEVFDAFREGGSWLKGGQGERKVAAELAKLPDEFAVFNDFHPSFGGVLSAWNVDHIVVGPTGLFVIETKNYSHPKVRAAEKDWTTKRNVAQADSYARDLKWRLKKWSGGQLDSLFVVPVVVYAQDGANVERPREGNVRVLPLKWLLKEISTHVEDAIDVGKVQRVARALWGQVPVGERAAFEDTFKAYDRLMGAMVFAGVPPQSMKPQVPETCPECGGRLVERVAKRGQHAGKPFVGCSGYPACKFMITTPKD